MRSFLSPTVMVLVALVALAFVASPVSGAIIFEDNFNGHAAGTLLSSYVPPVGASYVGPWKIIADGGVGGTNYTGQSTSLDVEQAFISAANTSAITGKIVGFDYDYFVTSAMGSSGSDFVTFNGAISEPARGWDLMLYGDGSIQYYNMDAGGGGYVNVAPANTFTRNDWVHVSLTADYGTHTFAATVGTFNFSGAWAAAGADTFQQLYMAPTGGNLFYIDNLAVTLIPEPAAMLLLGLGALVAMPCRRRPAG